MPPKIEAANCSGPSPMVSTPFKRRKVSAGSLGDSGAASMTLPAGFGFELIRVLGLSLAIYGVCFRVFLVESTYLFSIYEDGPRM